MQHSGETAYRRGFVHGMHYLLVALEGRLLRCETPAEMEAALVDYYQRLATLDPERMASGLPPAEDPDGPVLEYEVAG